MPADPSELQPWQSRRALSRRDFVKRAGTTALGLAGLGILAACGASSPTATTAKPAGGAPTAATGAGGAAGSPVAAGGAATGKLEMFSWWTTGGEEAGLKALYEMYRKTHPGVEIVNQAVAGAAGANAKAVLKNRMLGGDPPDSFQVHMGHELTDGYVAANQVEPLDDLYKDQKWDQIFPKGVLDIVSANGHYWSVPVNIHRANVLWYNKKLFADNSLQAPATFDDFFKVADALKAKGLTALALGDKEPFASGHLFEAVLLGTLGADGYSGLWTGKTKWDDAKVTDALNTTKKMLGYINSDHAALTWDQANDLLIQGKAGMTIMGDWVDADYKAKKFTDYGWANSPGTKGLYDALSDTFALPKNAKNRANAIDWLKLAGSREGQDAFNPLKGSIPARTDAGQGDYDAYLKSAIEDWKKDTIVPSVEHGAAAKDGWAQAYTDAINAFVTSQDVAKTQKALAQACGDAGVCK
jgi:glucose/mannose transport system substrate-binding protein